MRIQIRTEDGRFIKIDDARQILVMDSLYKTPIYVAEEVAPQTLVHCAVQKCSKCRADSEFNETLLQLGLALPPSVLDVNPKLIV